LEVREKASRDPVTEVDLACEELPVSAIRGRYPDDAILSEERGGEVSEDGRTWLLDPLDGTANYAKGLPLFCCCVSVLEAALYHASAGAGAWLDRAGETSPLRVGDAARLEDAFVGADSRLGGLRDAGGRRPLDRLSARAGR